MPPSRLWPLAVNAAALLPFLLLLVMAVAVVDASPPLLKTAITNSNSNNNNLPAGVAAAASTVTLATTASDQQVPSAVLMDRQYDGMSEAQIQQADTYRQQNPFFEQCIVRADKLSGEFGVGTKCGNVATMTKCTKSCRKSFESYFRTLTTACWVEIIVGLDKLHPEVAQHWKTFGEKIDTLCYHPPPPPKPRHKVAEEVPPKLPPVSDEPPEDDDDDDADEEPEQPGGDVNLKDDFEFPQRFSDGMDTEFPDRIVPAPYVKPDNIADKLPWKRQHLMGRVGKALDDKVPANLEPEEPEHPNVNAQHIGPADKVVSFDSEREKGWLPGLDND